MKCRLLTVILMLTCSSVVIAQDSTNQEAYDHALPQFTRLMGSESAARKHLNYLQNFAQIANRPFSSLVRFSQREQVAGISGDYFLYTTYLCGEVAAAQDADDDEYFGMMLVIFDMKLKNVSAYGGLEALTRMSVPAYRLLSKAIGKSEAETRRLALKDQMRVEVVPDAILAMVKDEYVGSIEARRKK